MLGYFITPKSYKLISQIMLPLIFLLLNYRIKSGKEDYARKGERIGLAGQVKPHGKLIWIHAASVGESLSALPLIEKLMSEVPNLNILITTVTRTSGHLLLERLPEGAIHQYAPLDNIRFVNRFLSHWKPDIALWIESELWPNLVLETHNKNIPMVLVNARITNRSIDNWKKLPLLSKPMINSFRFILSQSKSDQKRFQLLGAERVYNVGNIKFDSLPIPADDADYSELKTIIGLRPVWIAASTHYSEEKVIAHAHRKLRDSHPGLLTIICPRHPIRGNDIERELTELGLEVCSRTGPKIISEKTDIYLADTLGEMGLFYRLADIAFIGGSLSKNFGHNPVEAAKLNCALISGYDMRNFEDAVNYLTSKHALTQIRNEEELTTIVDQWLSDPTSLKNAKDAAIKGAEDLSGALEKTMEILRPILDCLVSKEKKYESS